MPEDVTLSLEVDEEASRMKRTCLPGIALMFLTGPVVADEARTDATAQASDLEVVLVTGEQPGPALWKVTSGNHVLWILGEVAPLARKLKWRSKQFESLLATSQEVLLHDAGHWYSDRNLNREVARARQLPDGQSLKDIVSSDLYGRTEAVWKMYDVHEPLEELSPGFAGRCIANASLKTLDVRLMSLQASVAALARKAKVRITTYSTPEIPVEEHIQAVRNNAMAVCPLERVVQLLEDGGAGLRRLANAWALGDIDALRRLEPEYGIFTAGNRSSACMSAYGHASQERADEYKVKRTATWVAEAERALRENESTLAVVPMPELFAADGYLAALRARGYEVVEPE